MSRRNLGPRIASIAHAVPEHILNQEAVIQALESLYSNSPEFEKYLPAFRNTKIENRYSCVPMEWFFSDHGWADRMAIYQKQATELLAQVTTQALLRANLKAEDIDSIITVSTTGISAPSLESFLMDRFNFKSNLERTPIWGWGCAGGVLGLKRAHQLAQSDGGKNVLLLNVELCSLSFRQGSENPKDIIAAALFGDGASAVVIGPSEEAGWRVEFSSEHRWPDSTGVMGWDVANDGLSVVFSKKIPDIVEHEYPILFKQFLKSNQLNPSDINHFVAHPGGAKIVETLEKIYSLSEGGLAESRSVLKDFGNMSSVTVMVALQRFFENKAKNVKSASGNRVLLSTFGPGFSCAMMTLKQDSADT